MSETSTQPEEPKVETKTEDIKFFNIHDGLRGRDGGPYLDQMEVQQAEIQRAKVEGREPDFDKPGSSAGTPLVTIDKVPDNVYANPSMDKQNTDLQDAVGKVLEENTTATNPQTLSVTYAVTEPAAEEAPAEPAPTKTTTASKTTSSSTAPSSSSSSSS